MKKTILRKIAPVILGTLPISAFAQAAAVAPPATATAAGHYTTTSTDVGTLLADPAAKAVVEKHFPGLTTSDSISMASSMTLRQLQQYKADVFTDKSLAETDVDLAKLPAK